MACLPNTSEKRPGRCSDDLNQPGMFSGGSGVGACGPVRTWADDVS